MTDLFDGQQAIKSSLESRYQKSSVNCDKCGDAMLLYNGAEPVRQYDEPRLKWIEYQPGHYVPCLKCDEHLDTLITMADQFVRKNRIAEQVKQNLSAENEHKRERVIKDLEYQRETFHKTCAQFGYTFKQVNDEAERRLREKHANLI